MRFWQDIEQVWRKWQDIAQVRAHLLDILPKLPHLRSIVPGARSLGRICRKCGPAWRDEPQVRLGFVRDAQRMGHPTRLRDPFGILCKMLWVGLKKLYNWY